MLKWMIVVSVCLYVVICLALAVSQRSLIYFPQPRGNANATMMTLRVDGADLIVTTRESEGADAVVYFGGNAEDVSLSLGTLERAFPRAALYLLHYRGYGGSAGRPSQDALFADALSLFDHVRVGHENITAIGRSLGSGVAIYLASRRPVSRVVLVTPFDSLAAVAAAQFPFVPVRWLLRDPFLSEAYASAVDAPTLLLVAGQDEVIPPRHATALLRHFRPRVATMRVIDGVGHNTIDLSPDYVPLLGGRR